METRAAAERTATDVVADLITSLPDAILGTIISLLPTKDGARTQAISRQWRHLWRSAPLHLDAGYVIAPDGRTRASIVSAVLSTHPGPTRRFSFDFYSMSSFEIEYMEFEGWFHSQTLNNLQELDINCGNCSALYYPAHPLPPSALRFASTLLKARFSLWNFPDEIAPLLNFPLVKQLTLSNVRVSEDVFRGVISGCNMLESLSITEIHGARLLRVCSSTLRSIGFDGTAYPRGMELLIEDAPRLQKLLQFCPGKMTVRIMKAPKLQIIGGLVWKQTVSLSLANSIHAVKVLSLEFSESQVNTALDILRWFPCLEKLYVIIYQKVLQADQCNYDSLLPIECLETHLRKVVLKNYDGCGQDVDFAKFFLSNAKVLEKFEFGFLKTYSKKWVADQHSLLQMENGASTEAQLEFRETKFSYFNSGSIRFSIHDLSMVDPFDGLHH